MRTLNDIRSLDHLERAARRRLPRFVFDAVAGAAGDERTLLANRRGYDDIKLFPRVLADPFEPDLSTEVLGRRVSSPVMLAPTGFQGLCHRDAELAAARAAANAGVMYALATAAGCSLEAVAAASGTGPRWYQLYLRDDEAATDHLVDRAAAAGYDALCLTVDTAARGFRERDHRNRFSLPLAPAPGILAQAAVRPGWTLEFLRGRLVGRPASLGRAQYTGAVFPPPEPLGTTRMVRSATWAALARLRRRWSGPLVVKGVLRGDQAGRLVDEIGVDGIVVSNHGGRLLDTGLATVEALPDVVAAVQGRAQVFVDGGIRRGTDVAKALALGADGCLIGRPLLYGLAVGGEAGVSTALALLNAELGRTMAQLGAHTIRDLDRSLVRLPHERWTVAPHLPATVATSGVML